MTAPLSRNRNYQLLWSSKALAEFGAQASYRLPAAGVVADGIGIGYRTGAGYKRRSGTCCRFAGRGLGGPVESQEGHARLRSGKGNCRHDSCRRAGGRSGERCAYSDSGCGDGRVLGAIRTSGKRLFAEPDVDRAGTEGGGNERRPWTPGAALRHCGRGVSCLLSEDSCHSRWTC